MDTLYAWQVPSRDRLVQVLSNPQTKTALDLSATGCGKTYVALAAAQILKQTPLVIAPKSAISTWKRVAAAMEIPLLGVYNVEQLKLGKTPHVSKVSKKNYRWALPAGSLVIVDEAHRFSGIKTDNAVLLAQTRQYGLRTLLLSATLSDQGPLGLRAVGYLLGIHNFTVGDFYQFALRNGCYKNLWNGIDFMKGPGRIPHLLKLKQLLAPYSVRVTTDMVPNFPENFIVPELVDVDESQRAEVEALYAAMDQAIVEGQESPNALVAQLRARQCSEVAKIPILTDMVCDAIDEDKNVVVFLAFLDSIDLLRAALLKRGWQSAEIRGVRTAAERDEAVRKFQHDEVRVLVCQVASGGESISLHHTETSKYARMSFICPDFSATHFVQALGRCPRAGGLSKVIQKIVLMSGTVEEKVYKAIQRKITNLACLTDDEMKGVV